MNFPRALPLALPLVLLALFTSATISQTAGADTGTAKPVKWQKPVLNALLQPWIKNGEEFSVSHIETLVNWANHDPEAQALVAHAMELTRSQSVAEFSRLFFVKPNESTTIGSGGFRVGGEFRPASVEFVSIPLKAEDCFLDDGVAEAKPEYRDRIEAIRSRADVFYLRVQNRGVRLLVSYATDPSIYLSPRETLQQTYESFIHELTHFVSYDFAGEPDVLAYDTAAQWEVAYLLAPGQEVDARLSGVRALIRLSRQWPSHVSLDVVLEQWFSKTGAVLLPQERLIPIVRDFMGYRVQDLWVNRLALAHMNLDTDVRFLKSLMPGLSGEALARADALLSERESQVKRAIELYLVYQDQSAQHRKPVE